ncbi:MAG: restriction endonuclease subunit S [Desulfovibrio sp.]
MTVKGDNKLGDFFASRRNKGLDTLPVLSVTLNNGLVERTELDRKSESTLAPEEHLLVRKGDIAYNMMRMWQGASGIADKDGIVSPAYVVCAPKNGVDSKYAAYAFKSPQLIHLFWAYSYGLTNDRLRLYYKDFAKIPVTFPPLPEQKMIARILSTWDKAIETVDKLIENSQQQKKALMQQLLTGKKRLPGFTGEWNTTKLNKLCNVRRGASPRPISDAKWFADEGRGWIRIADATASESRYLTETTQKLSPLGVEKSVSVDPGDLIMSICGTIGVPRILSIAACIHDGFVVFRDYADKLHLEYLYHYLNLFALRLANSGQPGTQKNLNTTIVGNLEVPLISIEEQIAIANVLNKAEEHALSLQREHEIFRIQKQALMQQLLTGKRRVAVSGEA